MIALVDCNNFMSAANEPLILALEGEAVGVLSNNDGCVIARSNDYVELRF